MNDRSPATAVEPDHTDSAETENDQLAPLGTFGGLAEVAPLGHAVIEHHRITPPQSAQ